MRVNQNHTLTWSLPRDLMLWKKLGLKKSFGIQALQCARVFSAAAQKVYPSPHLLNTTRQIESAIWQLKQGNNAHAICPEMALHDEKALSKAKIRQGEMEASTLAINGLINALSQKLTALFILIDLLKKDPSDSESLEDLNTVIKDINNYFNSFNLFRYAIDGYEYLDVKGFFLDIVKSASDDFPGSFDKTVLKVSDDMEEIKTSSIALSIILESLLKNAYEATKEKGDVSVYVKKAFRQSAKGIEIRVVDSGKGIALEVEEKIFRPFFTTDPSETAEQKGLSLALVQHAVYSLGGEIEVETKQGQGTNFTVWLPMHPPERENRQG